MSTVGPVRPFRVDVPEEDLDDLRRRVAATRWPRPETAGDQSRGVQLRKIQELVRYWGTYYDWRNVFPGEHHRAPRSATEQACCQLIYVNEVDKGGHFAAREEPELVADGIRAAFRSLRGTT